MTATTTLGRVLRGCAASLATVVGLAALPSPNTAWSAESVAELTPTAQLSALFPRSEAFDFDPPAPGSYALPPLKIAPDGAVLDHRARDLRLANILDGRISLVSFIYLLCSDEQGCPLALSTLFDIHQMSAYAPGLREDVQLVTLSFDPERDTPEAIDSFAYPIQMDREADKKLDWHVLTTRDLTTLQPILDGFGQAVDRSGNDDTIQHLLRLFLVDRQGRIRNIYGLGMIDPRLLMTDVETLLIEERTQ